MSAINHREPGEFGDGATMRSGTFFRGRDTGSIFARLPNGNFLILHGRGPFANQEGGLLRRADVMAGNGVKPIDCPAASLWTCFHCGDVFTDEAEAREHFGDTMDDEPICQVTAERYRAVERELDMYRNESDATSKTFYDIGHRAAVAEREAEQKGYDRGIADAKAHPHELGLVKAENRNGTPERVQELMEANNRLLERARAAESGTMAIAVSELERIAGLYLPGGVRDIKGVLHEIAIPALQAFKP